GYARHLRRREVQHFGARLDAFGGHRSLHRLQQMQHRQQRGPRLGVTVDDLLQLVQRGLAQLVLAQLVLAHRSTPPMTGSILASATTTSAIMPPSVITEVPCRFTKDGSRKCARYGRVPPSETT